LPDNTNPRPVPPLRFNSQRVRDRPPTGPRPVRRGRTRAGQGESRFVDTHWSRPVDSRPHFVVCTPGGRSASPAVDRMGEPVTRSDQGKLGGVLVVTALSVWFLFPSYQFYAMTPAQRAALEPAKLAQLRKKAVHLGLDLQGGLQLLLE